MVVCDHIWLYLVIHGWMYMIIHGYTWLWVVMYRIDHCVVECITSYLLREKLYQEDTPRYVVIYLSCTMPKSF